MFFTKGITDHKLGPYTDDPVLAKALGFNIKLDSIDIGYDGCAYEAGFAPVRPKPTYIELRIAEYPAISDQLDMIYWDHINGTNVWTDTIKKIKEKYPKQ